MTSLDSASSSPPEHSTANCFGLVLAAGSSRRFGSDKRLHELPDGEPLALRTLRQWSAAVTQGHGGLTELFVVTRSNGAAIGDDAQPDPLVERLALLDIAITVITAADSALGMGHSLAAAMRRIPPGPVIVGLADMPFVLPATISHIASRLSSAPNNAIVRPSYNKHPGNPIGFGSDWRAKLAQTTGDAGARGLVRNATTHNNIIDLAVDDPGILKDIDQRSDL